MWQSIIENLPIYIPTIALFVGFYQLNTTRKDNLRNVRFLQYQELINKIHNGHAYGLIPQLSSIYFLIEYREYASLTLKVFRENKYFSAGKNVEPIQSAIDDVCDQLEKLSSRK